jgi:hypothetical protein
LAKNQAIISSQNECYFESKARMWIKENSEDQTQIALLKMLLKNINKKIEDFLPSPHHQKFRDHFSQNVSTAPTAHSLSRKNLKAK